MTPPPPARSAGGLVARRDLLVGSAACVVAAVAAPRWSFAERAPILLQAQPAVAPIYEDAGAVPVWAYREQVPGPVLRVRQGDRLTLRLKNDLPQPTSIHWHGIRLDNAMDGVAGLTQDPVPPGGSFEYDFTAPDAGTFWYHPHYRSWEQVARGLYGVLIVEERERPDFDRDIVFVADDWRIDRSGKIDEASLGAMRDWSHGGRLGNWLTVNGRSQPDIVVRAGDRIRLRCVNVANARIFSFDFGALDPRIIALDGQPVPVAELGDAGLTLAPGQRADLVIDVPEEAVSYPIPMTALREPIVAARFVVSASGQGGKRRSGVFSGLPANPLPARLDRASAQRIELVMEGGAMGGLREARFEGRQLGIRDLVRRGKAWAFNGIVGHAQEPLARIARGRTAEINMVNRTAWPHAMHLHGHHFRVVERNGRAVAAAPWRDTELVDRDEQVRIAFLADNPGKWLLHCHMLEHHAAGMVTWIEVA